MTPCEKCGGRRLLLGGWMGATRAVPFPAVCPCTWADMNKREQQLLQVRYAIEHYDAPTLVTVGLGDLVGERLAYRFEIEKAANV